MSSFWSWWIIILTVVSFIGVYWLLMANRSGAPADPEQTTGHAADGIEEYDNPLPYWWFLMFLFTIIFGVGYLIAYPGLGNFKGVLNWTQIDQWQQSVDQAEERFGALRFKYLAMPVEEVAQDPEARKMGQRMFANNCAQCHGADARGSYGFPNLSDDDWLWGGSADDLKTSITKGRMAAMPAWGPMLGDDGVTNVAAYVLNMSGRDVDAEQAAAGKAQFEMVCAACHGADGTGNPLFGAPNLANGIWLYGGEPEQVMHSIRTGRNGVMPAHEAMLGEDKIHLITAYVYSLNR
jgi:cytochrome c oxidase cbb3-type subunit 3